MREGTYILGSLLFFVLVLVSRGVEQDIFLLGQWLLIAFWRLDQTISERR